MSEDPISTTDASAKTPTAKPKGPWELPVERPARVPVFKRPTSIRMPIVNNWGGLVAILLLIFVAPPVIGWISRALIGLLSGR